MFKRLLLAGLALSTPALAAPETYQCAVHSHIGSGSIMQAVDTIIVDEAEKTIRFLTANSDSGASPMNASLGLFQTFSSGFFAVSGDGPPVQALVFDREKGMATHSYTLPAFASATTWRCSPPEPPVRE